MFKLPSIYLPIHLLTFLLSLNHGSSQLSSSNQEESILLRLKQHWQNPWSLYSWTPENSPHCNWPEIGCTNGSVTDLKLGDKNITGNIPPFISDLKNLSFLNLSYNNIGGNFPESLFNLSKLDFLDLSQNYFVGPIPDGVDRLARLSFLNLCANNFSGNIPAAIGRLPELRYLQLHQNQFNGTFPDEIGNLSNLEVLYMAYNEFLPSRLPSNFTQLKKLKELWISEGNLIGEIPDMIGEMEALEYLDLSGNTLTGKIPKGLFMLKNLSVVYLHKNMLSGEIPQDVGALGLTDIDVSDNNLTGTIPEDFGKLEELAVLNLFFNQLSGEIPESLGHLPALLVFKLFSNNLSGHLPPDLGKHSALEEFQVASNRLTGALPEYLCSGGHLVGVVAFDNNLSGELPESLGNCNSLRMVSISNNAFSGNIPTGLWTAPHLEYMMISENAFAGELPNQVSSNLSLFEISYNRFSGKIPVGVSSWMNVVIFNASNNSFTGTVPQELTALPLLTTLLLDNNQLTGSLPSEIISWKSLTTLNLSRNQLSGLIPEEIGFLPVLTELDLSYNQLSGQIPMRIGSLRLTSLNLSSNRLSGEIPRELENGAYENSFVNNPGLCAKSSFVNLNACDSALQKSSNSNKFLALIITSSAAVILLGLLLLFVMIRIRRKKKHRLDTTWKLTSFQKLNFNESSILSGLTESNMIGSGGSGKVYRVAADHPGGFVAVKRISSHGELDLKLQKLFLAEVEILSQIRHLNIVKLLCCISNDNSMLLVYEYVQNRSLDQWLHVKKRSASVLGSTRGVILDWPKRMEIAVGAARGLHYMHHEYSTPIVHRDVKSSNILLDSNFKAKIADFGLARLLAKEGELATVSTVAGSFGYIAPEYAKKPRVNEKIDVYSFGVVLLELTTGKEANYGDENSGLVEWARRHIQIGNPIVDALDEDAMEPCHLEEMSCVFVLGLKCTGSSPDDRPTMKEVLQILLRSSHPLVYGIKNTASELDAIPLLNNSKREKLSECDDDCGLASIVIA